MGRRRCGRCWPSWGDTAVVQRQHALPGEAVQTSAEQLLAAHANRPRLGALRVIRQRQHETTQVRVGFPDVGLTIVLASPILALSRRAGGPRDDGRLLRSRFLAVGAGARSDRHRDARHRCRRVRNRVRRRGRASETRHRLGQLLVDRHGAGWQLGLTDAAVSGVSQAHLLRRRRHVTTHVGHVRVIGIPSFRLNPKRRPRPPSWRRPNPG